MHPYFSVMDERWFHRVLHTAVYSNLCYELAQDKEERDFPWNEEGVEALKAWYQSQYEKFLAAHEA